MALGAACLGGPGPVRRPGLDRHGRLGSGDLGRYTFACHREFLDALLETLGVGGDVVLVVHDWGSALGFDWARRHPGQVRAIAYM
jgi:haloalkane dehalogenase